MSPITKAIVDAYLPIIKEVGVDIAAVGTAVFGVFVAIKLTKWLRMSLSNVSADDMELEAIDKDYSYAFTYDDDGFSYDDYDPDDDLDYSGIREALRY